MNLPNRENAYIPLQKLSAYLLSDTHAVGRSKARFLRSLGFDEANMSTLEQGLLAIAHAEEVLEVVDSRHGTKYVIEGALQTPGGATAWVRTVWIIDTGEDRPRFVTAYPT